MMIFKGLMEILRQKNLLEPAIELTAESLERARQMTQVATDHLFEGVEPPIDLYETDHQINAAEIQVRRMVFEHLVAQGSDHLTTSTILMTTITDVERIGDYAKNLHQQVERLDGAWPKGPVFDRILGLRDELMPLFDDAIQALSDADEELATQVMQRHARFADASEAVVDELCGLENARSSDVIVATLAARSMKRIGAHLKNLASSVVNPIDRIGYRPTEIGDVRESA